MLQGHEATDVCVGKEGVHLHHEVWYYGCSGGGGGGCGNTGYK